MNFNVKALDSEKLKAELLLNIRSCLLYLLPGGTFHKNEFQVGDIRGNKGKSLRVELNGSRAGLWNDFATEDRGDIIDLWAAVHGKNARTEFPQVMASIGEWLRYDTEEQHNNKKLATHSWDYCDENGQIVVKIYRYDLPQGEKEYKPFDVKRSVFAAPEGMRPLYNIQAS